MREWWPFAPGCATGRSRRSSRRVRASRTRGADRWFVVPRRAPRPSHTRASVHRGRGARAGATRVDVAVHAVSPLLLRARCKRLDRGCPDDRNGRTPTVLRGRPGPRRTPRWRGKRSSRLRPVGRAARVSAASCEEVPMTVLSSSSRPLVGLALGDVVRDVVDLARALAGRPAPRAAVWSHSTLVVSISCRGTRAGRR
jgi:hypothetical protein